MRQMEWGGFLGAEKLVVQFIALWRFTCTNGVVGSGCTKLGTMVPNVNFLVKAQPRK